jgi:hypothetical protein
MVEAQDADGAARSSAGRELARARWGTTVVDKAVATVIARAGQLGADQLDQLRQVTEAGQDREAGR